MVDEARTGLYLDAQEIGVLRSIIFWSQGQSKPLPWMFGDEFGLDSEIWPTGWRGLHWCPARDACIQKLISLGAVVPYNPMNSWELTVVLNADELAVVQCLMSGYDQDGEGLPDLPINADQFIRVCPDEWEGPAAEHPEREACKAKLIRMGLVVET